MHANPSSSLMVVIVMACVLLVHDDSHASVDLEMAKKDVYAIPEQRDLCHEKSENGWNSVSMQTMHDATVNYSNCLTSVVQNLLKRHFKKDSSGNDLIETFDNLKKYHGQFYGDIYIAHQEIIPITELSRAERQTGEFMEITLLELSLRLSEIGDFPLDGEWTERWNRNSSERAKWSQDQ